MPVGTDRNAFMAHFLVHCVQLRLLCSLFWNPIWNPFIVVRWKSNVEPLRLQEKCASLFEITSVSLRWKGELLWRRKNMAQGKQATVISPIYKFSWTENSLHHYCLLDCPQHCPQRSTLAGNTEQKMRIFIIQRIYVAFEDSFRLTWWSFNHTFSHVLWLHAWIPKCWSLKCDSEFYLNI